VTTTNKPRGRGRPRRFDPDAAVATAQALFHAHGYDGVSVSALAGALGINPPSFYAAFGSKAGLFARVMERYNGLSAVPIAALLRHDQPLAACLAAVLEAAARLYAADPEAAGCLVIEAARCQEREASEAARAYTAAAEGVIRDHVAARRPAQAEVVTDFVTTTMAGLSAKARAGHGPDRLVAIARMAGLALRQALPD